MDIEDGRGALLAANGKAGDSNSKNDIRKSVPTRIEIPGLEKKSVTHSGQAKSKLHVRHSALEVQSAQSIAMEDKLRMTLNPLPPQAPKSAPKGVVTAAEERVRMFEEMSRKKARQKLLRNFIESAMLLMAVAVFVGLVLWWMSHKNKVEAEAVRIAAERIRLAEEQDRVDRAKREKDRLEREAALARAKEARLREQEEKDRIRREEQSRREREERKIRDDKERYQMFSVALMSNSFRLFGKSVTNDIATVGGELCYLLPSETMPAPLYWVAYGVNGGKQVFRLNVSGQKEEIGCDVFDARIKGQEYLVAKEGNVYFRSVRKTPGTGVLGKKEDADPADAFFGSMATTVKGMKASYDELTFDVFFTPKNSTQNILVKNVEFGCTYSLEEVREAIAQNTPNITSCATGFKAKKFKRTVKFWEGADVKQGVEGITYVPRTPPPIRTRWAYSNHDLPGYRTIYHSRTVREDNNRDRWQTLYNRALEEEAEEKSYYEKLRAKQAERKASAQLAAEAKWRNKVDEILKNGTLWYKIRKARTAK